MIGSLDKQISELYEHSSLQESFHSSSILVMSHEGQVIVELGKKVAPGRVQQMGVLMVGAWQASLALNEEGGHDSKQVLSLASSSSGFLVLPFSHHHKLVLGVVFNDDINPGKLKMKSKLLRDFLSENLASEQVSVEENNSDGYLFKNITDDELDKLFSFAGI